MYLIVTFFAGASLYVRVINCFPSFLNVLYKIMKKLSNVVDLSVCDIVSVLILVNIFF
jgi:hypothetical protein